MPSVNDRFSGIAPFEKKIYLSSPTMHGDEKKWVEEAFRTNWVSTVGENINEIEKEIAAMLGVSHAVALGTGTSSIHLALRLAGEKVYGKTSANVGILSGKHVFASDLTFAATVNPAAYEGAEIVFIDSERDTWNLDPEALSRAFRLFPDTRIVVLAHLYGTPAKMEQIRAICDSRGAVIVEDAAEALGAKIKIGGEWKNCGALGEYNCISFNGNKIITGSSGGMFLSDSEEDAAKVRKWSTQSREPFPWYQHEDLGFNYRMSNLIAGVVRGQLPHLREHIAQKRAIWERYEKGLRDLPVKMNPFDRERSEPNFWLSCLTIDKTAFSPDPGAKGKTDPAELLSALARFNAEGRPIWKPMHLQPLYRGFDFITASGAAETEVAGDLFARGLCLPSDNKMTPEEQDRVIEILHRCF